MSGVYIPNMGMPKSCAFCRFWTHCECLNGQGITDYSSLLHSSMGKNRHPKCPLKEVPTHGRLGDLDALAEHIKNVYCKDCKRSKVMCKACEYGDMIDEIENAPTIIEAST